MLYERWQRIATEHPGELALHELQSNRCWTFAELAREAGANPAGGEPIVYPQGQGAKFILAVLSAWRRNAIVCPLESDQTPPGMPVTPPSYAHLKTTSATTGAPRLVAFTAAQLAADVDHIVRTMGLRREWPNLGAISMAHSYGFSNLVLPLLLHGVPLLIASSPLPEAIRRAANGWSALTLAGVPALWRAWHEANAIPKSVHLAISAGAPLPVALEQAVFDRSGLKIHNFYGSSECGGIAYDDSEVPRSEESCAGRPLAGVTLSVGTEGCLAVCGPNVAETYWPEPDASLGQGRFQTRDLVELRQGKVYLCGRASDLINVAGRKVAPELIERVLRQHPAVRDCLVFGLPGRDGQRGDTIAAVVVAAGSGPDVLREFLLARMPAWQLPREWWFVESLSTNQRGKISRAEWRNRFLHSNRREG